MGAFPEDSPIGLQPEADITSFVEVGSCFISWILSRDVGVGASPEDLTRLPPEAVIALLESCLIDGWERWFKDEASEVMLA